MLTSNKKALAVFLIAFKFVRYLHFIRPHMCRKMAIIDSFDKRYYFNITNQEHVGVTCKLIPQNVSDTK